MLHQIGLHILMNYLYRFFLRFAIYKKIIWGIDIYHSFGTPKEELYKKTTNFALAGCLYHTFVI